VRAAWHSELRSYMIAGAAKGRWVAIERVVDAAVPQAQARRRKLAAASIRYHLSASTWHYYRFVFRFTIDEAIEAVEEVIDAQLASLGKPRATRNPPTRRVGRR
jgi:hypothetical protein